MNEWRRRRAITKPLLFSRHKNFPFMAHIWPQSSNNICNTLIVYSQNGNDSRSCYKDLCLLSCTQIFIKRFRKILSHQMCEEFSHSDADLCETLQRVIRVRCEARPPAGFPQVENEKCRSAINEARQVCSITTPHLRLGFTRRHFVPFENDQHDVLCVSAARPARCRLPAELQVAGP